MHELGIATGVMQSVVDTAKQNNAIYVKSIDVVFGTSSAIIKDALQAAFDALKDLDGYNLCKNAKINIKEKESKSICLDCGEEFIHGIGASQCPKCNSYKTEVIEGFDIYIDKIEIEQED